MGFQPSIPSSSGGSSIPYGGLLGAQAASWLDNNCQENLGLQTSGLSERGIYAALLSTPLAVGQIVNGIIMEWVQLATGVNGDRFFQAGLGVPVAESSANGKMQVVAQSPNNVALAVGATIAKKVQIPFSAPFGITVAGLYYAFVSMGGTWTQTILASGCNNAIGMGARAYPAAVVPGAIDIAPRIQQTTASGVALIVGDQVISGSIAANNVPWFGIY
jgi:hypothetical protein